MTIEQACASIMGKKLSNSIIADQGIAWCVVAAMAQATTADDPVALHTIRAWNAQQKRTSSLPPADRQVTKDIEASQS
jgi:hypothetical protein